MEATSYLAATRARLWRGRPDTTAGWFLHRSAVPWEGCSPETRAVFGEKQACSQKRASSTGTRRFPMTGDFMYTGTACTRTAFDGRPQSSIRVSPIGQFGIGPMEPTMWTEFY